MRPITQRAYVHCSAMRGRAEAILGAFERHTAVAERLPRGWWRSARCSRSSWQELCSRMHESGERAAGGRVPTLNLGSTLRLQRDDNSY